MGYLNNNIITVDAILTKKGRETLAKKVSHRIGSVLDVKNEKNDITHMGDKIIEDESTNTK